MRYLIFLFLVGCKNNAVIVRTQNQEIFQIFCQDQAQCIERLIKECTPHYYDVKSFENDKLNNFRLTANCLPDTKVEN